MSAERKRRLPVSARGRPSRVYLLDEWRGAAVVTMVAYHAAYDLVFLFGVPLPWATIRLIQPAIAGSFILLAGISCRFSRDNLRRGLITLGLGVLVSAVTYFFMPSEMIWFGVLHFLGVSMLLFALLHRLLDRLPPPAGMLISLILYICTLDVPRGTLGPRGLPGIALPSTDIKWLMPFGFGGAGSDYFPLLPYFFLFLVGAYFGVYVKSMRAPAFFYRSHAPGLASIGRQTIVIYLLHQPIIYGVLLLVFKLIR